MTDKRKKTYSGHFPPLTVIPDIKEFNIDNYCKEVSKFISIGENKRNAILRLYSEQKNREIKKAYETVKEPYKDVLPVFTHYHEILRKFAETAPHFTITEYITRKIFQRIGKSSVIKKYQTVVYNLMVEINEDYYKKPLHSINADSKIYRPDTGIKKNMSKIQVLPYKNLGRTTFYKKFLNIIKYLNQRLFITYPFLRRIKLQIEDGLPKTALNFDEIRTLEGMNLADLQAIFEKRLMRANLRVESVWYMELVKFLSVHKTPVRSAYLQDYFNAADGLISLYVSLMIRHTMEEFVKFVTDPVRTPYFQIVMYYDNKFKLSPSPEEITEYYNDVLRSIGGLCAFMKSLEFFYSERNDQTNYIKLDIPDNYTQVLIDEIVAKIAPLFSDVQTYMDNLVVDFFPIYDEQSQSTQINNPTLSFYEAIQLLEFYREYINKLSEIVPNVYFSTCVVNTSAAVEQLRTNGENIIAILKDKLIKLHMYENLDICEMLEFIRMRAETVPKTTDELVELGQYMIWASTEHLADLAERIKASMEMMTRLVINDANTEENGKLMTKTFNMLQNIKIVLDQNASMLERVKFEFEELLQRTVEKVTKGIHDIIPLLDTFDDMDDASRATEYMMHLRAMIKKIRQLDSTIEWINREEVLFKFPVSAFAELNELKKIIFPFFRLIYICHLWKRYVGVWMDGPFEYLDFPFVEETVENFYKEVVKTGKLYRSVLKQAVAEGGLKAFNGLVDDPDPLNQPAPIKLCQKYIQNIKEFRPVMYVISIFSNPALCQRHWDEMSALIGFDLTPDAGTTLRKIMAIDFGDLLEAFEIISTGATKERQLEIALAKMKAEWLTIMFKTSPYKDTGVNILIQLDDIIAILDDHVIKTLTMRGSVFVKHIEAEVKEWYEKLLRMSKTIDSWGKVQAQWLYLLPIFSSKDIVAQMPEEGVLFKEVDNTYRRYMMAVAKDPRVIETAGALGVLEAMNEALSMLDEINEGVANYLEKKRLVFPRFFFLSNDEMLEILSETKDPNRVQPHLHKCFEGINKLEIDSALVIHSMFSGENEQIIFVNTINTEDAHGGVEKWLVQVEDQMLMSVLKELALSYEDYQKRKRSVWLLHWPGQIVLAISQINWSAEVHRNIKPEGGASLQKYHLHLEKQLLEVVEMIRLPTLSNLNRITIKALIVIDVHAKDVVKGLADADIKEEIDFKWLAQLRYYWEDDRCIVRMINASIPYANEYLGNSDRLVITPLTDRCYRTLIGAYHLHLNGAPEGPAGTGKTETTKDLAKALAVQCVVFNCSDGLDYIAMGKFFKGLASTGAWACFDEFNRIELEVLSVIAQQILCIIMAVRGHLEKFIFEGTELTLNPNVYICITMNPGYAGRSELPDNLKVLFRTVAMMVPDYAMIGEISLYSYGFHNARVLSVKIVTTYRLCSEQLSSQNHYDYGMRAVKTVLSACGNIKRKFPDENEDILLLRSLIDVNLPKFLTYDVALFEGIISDLFPGIVLPTPDYTNIFECCHEICKERYIQPREIFLTKVIQMYEMMIVRHGFMLVGDPYSGKTSVLKVLADTLGRMFDKGYGESHVEYQFVNPKAVTLGQLYGQFDPISYEWFDGVVATCFRRFCMDPSEVRKWVVFDGPVDAVWIENMNTVLDDNKKLCLTSGEVMAMTSVMSMIFEVMDLAQASPATVSRCGMIYMESANLGWRPFTESWIESGPSWCEASGELILRFFDWLIDPCLEFVRKQCTQYVTAGEINLVITTIKIMEMTINNATESYVDDNYHIGSWLQGTMLFAITWGIAGILDRDSRVKFGEFFGILIRGENPEFPIPAAIEKWDIPIPDGPMSDFVYEYKTHKGSWKYWPDIVKATKMEENQNIHMLVVPTLDTVRFVYLIQMHVQARIPFLIVGPTGTGKSFYIQDYLMYRVNSAEFEPAFIAFTAQTKANATQDLIISKLIKGKKGVYLGAEGKTAVIFIDDLNMPAKDTYGSQPPIELLRQYLDHKHWYNFKDTSKIYLHNVLFVAAMGLVGGSRQEIYPRLLRHFCTYAINEFSEESMQRIFQNILLLAYKQNGFAGDVLTSVIMIVQATLGLYKASVAELRPTPAKSHYVFNLRDVSRIIHGCGMLKKDTAEGNKKIFPKLWVHESLRIIYDRLIENADKKWFYNKLRDCVREYFKDHFDVVFENLKQHEEDDTVSEERLSNLLFGFYLDMDATEEDKKYEEVESIEVFKNIAQNVLDEYNSTHKNKMDIVLFRYALEHLSKLCRVLQMPNGNALLVGIGGSGRQSLTRLATAICSHSLLQPEITKNYGLNEFRDDIKLALKESGGFGKHAVFLFTEDQLKEEAFLQDIDSLLNSGEVPNLYPIEERQEIIEIVRLAAQGGNRNLDISPLAVFSFFINRVKEKLHIVLSFSPIGSAFRTRLRLYPSIVNCCTIDWYEDWPENALEMVAEYWMQSMNVTQEIKDASVDICKDFHIESRQICALFYEKYGRKTYITSASYLDLIKSYQSLMKRKQEELTLAKFRYLNGLDKLAFAAEQVAVMQLKLEELQPQLEAANTRAKAMLKQIEKETREAEYASMLVREDEKVANVQAAAAQELKADCEADLAQVIPILEEAIDALNTLKPADITLVKSMKNPPSVVKLVMAAICVMKDIKPDRVPEPGTGRMVLDYWGPSKRVLGEMTFLQQLKDFDKDHIPIAVITKIRKEYITNKDFRPEIVAKASSAAEGLCKWIIAMDLYDKVARIVAPKKEKLEMAESEYAATMAILQEKRDQVTRLEERLRDLNAQLEEAQAEQEALQNSVDLCREKLIRAKKLIDGLGGEKTRWTMVAGDLQVQFDSLAGDILISCGVIAYLAPLTIQYRNECIANWRQKCIEKDIPCSKEYDFITVLGSDITIQQWYIDGLPRDAFSTQNAIIQNSSCRWSLLVDPQNQANKWIKLMEKKNNLSVVKFNDPTYMKVIENSIEFGMPVLIENIQETLDAPIDPILSNKIFKQGGILVIALGDNVIPYHRSFRLYLTTKLRNPHYMPEVFNKVTIINFALTMQGLEDQLLGIVVANERPDLQKKKEQLVQESAENRTALKNVEDTILKTLAEAEGDILENETAIQVLDNAKDLAFNILQKQTVTKQTEESIEKFRLAYRPVAVHSTILYYSISDLPNVDPMYQYSLVWFINLYRMSILNSSKSNVLTQRLENIKTLFTYNLYSNVCRSLFEKDKTLYAFVLTMKVMESKGLLDKQEYSFFLTGGINVENPIRNPSTWLSKKSWDELCRLDELPAFRGIRDNFSKNTDLWQELYDSNAPQTHKLPGKWQDALSVFQRLLIIRIIRLDKLNLAVHQFVNNMMGSEYVTPPPFDLTKSYADSNHLSPLIFILSPGSDPMMPLTKFAERKGYASKFQSISLGQGQGPIAEAMIRSGMGTGSWVCLQNCHLAVSWMSNLEKICETMDDSNTSDTFRLWLTSYPSDKFPVSILQNGVKMTNEPPGGLHQNLRLSYLSDPIKDSEFYYSLGEKEFDFSRLIYGICFFHAVVQERRTFGPLGWNIPYGFNDSDLHISLQQLQMFMREQKEIPYEALTYLIGECNYGGRVTDDWDRRLIVTILDDFLNPSVVKDRNYVFAGNDKRYGLPMKTSYENYLEHISKLPEQHSPEVFGLHENAGITRDLQNALLMLTSLLLVEGEGSSAGGDTDQLLANLINELLVKIPDLYNIELAQKKFPVEYSESMNTVLVQEMERFNKLLRVMRTTLITLQNAILGIVAITPQLEMLANSLLLSRLPDAWASVSYPTLKPLGGYINDLIRRLEFLQTWHDEGKPPTFWLSGFFFTQAFLTGAKQNYARKSVTPIDQLDFDHIVLKEFYMNSVPSTGVHVNGLFVDGAHWDVQKGHLIEQKPKILWDELPVIWLKPILIEKFVEGNRYKSPVYKTSERRGILSTTGHSTNYVLPIFLTTTVGKAHWIKRSTALLCQLDE